MGEALLARAQRLLRKGPSTTLYAWPTGPASSPGGPGGRAAGQSRRQHRNGQPFEVLERILARFAVVDHPAACRPERVFQGDGGRAAERAIQLGSFARR